MRKINYALSGVMICLSLFFYFMSNTYTEDAALWPQFFSVLLILLSIGLLVDTHLKPNREKSSTDEESQEEKGNNLYLYYAIGATILYLVLMNIVGFLLLTPFFLWVLFWLLNYRTIKKLLSLSVGITIGITIIFQFLLNIPIPQGIISNLFI